MDIGFSEEQELLRDTARKFLDDNCATRFVRDMMATEAAVTPEFWRQLAENGWLGIAFPEAEGGSGLGLTDVVVLMEEIGRAVMPGPYAATVLFGGRRSPRPARRQRGRSGCRASPGAKQRRRLPGPSRTRAGTPPGSPPRRARRAAGLRCPAPRCSSPMRIWPMCSSSRPARRDGSTMEDGISLFLVPKDGAGLGIKLLPSVDETRKLCEVRLDNVRLPAGALLGELHLGWAPLARVVDCAAVALSAEMCGAAQRVLDMTVEYAKMRIAFGKPIGSYQGVKHKCADMLIDIENAKSLTYYAAWAVDEGDPDSVMAVSMAKAAASDAGRRVCAAGIQLHGGIGMTWEHDLHLYLKRAKADEIALGDASWHRERIARLMGT